MGHDPPLPEIPGEALMAVGAVARFGARRGLWAVLAGLALAFAPPGTVGLGTPVASAPIESDAQSSGEEDNLPTAGTEEFFAHAGARHKLRVRARGVSAKRQRVRRVRPIAPRCSTRLRPRALDPRYVVPRFEDDPFVN